MSGGEHMGIWHNWAVYRRAQVIYGIAIEKKKVLKDGVNSGKSDTACAIQSLLDTASRLFLGSQRMNRKHY